MRSPRVLVAEDNEQMRSALVRLLSPEFDVVRSVPDGERLVNAAISLKPDVIVTDVNLPKLTGLEAMRALSRKQHDIPFIMISADASMAEEYIRLGASHFVDKMKLAHMLIPAIQGAVSGQRVTLR